MQSALRPTGTLAIALTVALIATAVLGVMSSLMGLVQGLLFPGAALEAEPEDLGTKLLALAIGCHALIYLAVYIATIVLFCVFVHRANHNARALGAEGMEFTPGWTVGWFFVPFANLVKPYQAVREIYLASDPAAGAGDWQNRPAPGLLSTWWGFWLLCNFLGGIALRIALSDDPSVLALSPWFDVVDGLVDVPLALLALSVVKAIHRRQAEKAERALAPIA